MPGIIESYIHTGNQIGVLIELRCESKTAAMTSEFKTLAIEIAMQIAANPSVKYIKASDIGDRVIQQIKKESASKSDREAFERQIQEISLYDQFYIRDNSLTIEDLIKLSIAQLSENITVDRFSRFAIDDSDDLNPPSDPGSGVPNNPIPNSPSSLASEADIDS